MFTRTTGLLIVPLWLAAMSWLVAHDVWPALTAQDFPRVKVSDWLRESGSQARSTIHRNGRSIGSMWTEYLVGDETVERHDTLWFDPLPILEEQVRIDVYSTFTPEGLLDELTCILRTESLDRITLHGERFPADFSFTLENGPVQKAFKVPLIDGGLIGGAYNPFSHLEDLEVGRSWRMQVFNPLSVLTGMSTQFNSMLVQVTGEETVSVAGAARRCFIVEAPNAKAWVDRKGAVCVQEVTLPVMGTIRIAQQPDFNETELLRIRAISLRH